MQFVKASTAVGRRPARQISALPRWTLQAAPIIVLSTTLVLARPDAAWSTVIIGGVSNDRILSQLRTLKQDSDAFEVASPSLARIGRLQAAAEQVNKVERLVQLGQFTSARLQLREGFAATLRKDLNDAQDSSTLVSVEMARNVKVELEALDRGLRAQDLSEISARLLNVQRRLADVLTALRSTQS